MGLRPTHRDESPFLAPIDSKRVMRDFRRSLKALLSTVDQSVAGAKRLAASNLAC
jgi:hypothetical protein